MYGKGKKFIVTACLLYIEKGTKQRIKINKKKIL